MEQLAFKYEIAHNATKLLYGFGKFPFFFIFIGPTEESIYNLIHCSKAISQIPT